jgi:hypothetical protein
VEVQKDGVGGAEGLNGVCFIAVSPDRRHVYVTGNRQQAIYLPLVVCNASDQ